MNYKYPLLSLILLFFFNTLFAQKNCKKSIILCGQGNNIEENDSVVVEGYKYGIHNKSHYLYYKKHVKVMDGKYRIVLHGIDFPIQLSIAYYNGKRAFPKTVVGGLFVEPGDNITLWDTAANPYEIKFMGIGSEKLKINLYLMEQGAILSKRFQDFSKIDNNMVNSYDSFCNASLRYIEARKRRLSKTSYDKLVIGALLYCETTKYIGFVLAGKKSNFPFWNMTYQSRINRLIALPGMHMEYLGLGNYFLFKFRYECLNSLKNEDLFLKRYNYLKHNFRGKLRDVLITELLTGPSSSYASSSDGCLKNALGFVRTLELRRALIDISKTVGLGKIAYNFSLQDSFNVNHKLSDFRDSIIILDFWFTGCSGCLEQKFIMDTIERKYTDKKVKFVTISADKNKITWQNSLQKEIYSSSRSLNLLSDQSILPKYNITVYPTLIIIDKNGKIGPKATSVLKDRGEGLIKLIDILLAEN